MGKHVDLDGISNIRTLPEAMSMAQALLKYPVTKEVMAPLLRAYVDEPGHNTQVLDSDLAERAPRKSDRTFTQLAAMSAAHTSLTQLRNHVRNKLPETSAFANLSNFKLIETIERGMRVTRKALIDASGECYEHLLATDCPEREMLHQDILSYLGRHFHSIDVDGSLDQLLNNRHHSRHTTYYQINFPEETSGAHVYDHVFLVMTYVPELSQAWLNLLPNYSHAGAFHPGDRINLSSIGASVSHQLSRYDLV